MTICAFPHKSTPSDAARIVSVFERELAALKAQPQARNHDKRCALYGRLIEEYRAKAGMTSRPQIAVAGR
ncbi:MAG: hypothetical protein H7Z12_15235 [Rhodospirillaceae bacterium]|nr:hypothetical protein [Rhodospirillales bacterium]